MPITFCAKVLCETFCAKRFVRKFWAKRFGQFFFGTTFCIWGWVLGRVKGLGWPNLCETFCAHYLQQTSLRFVFTLAKSVLAHGFAADCGGGGGAAA